MADRGLDTLTGMTRDERMEAQTIAERDAAEDALSEAYALVMGHAPEWSNLFGYRDALSQIEWKLKRERDHDAMVTACGDAIGGFDQSTDSTKERDDD